MSEESIRTGSCLCGAVSYQVSGYMRPVIGCHCEQCRKTSGHHVMATACHRDDLTITENRGLYWYKSSDIAERGFCRECGGNLFYRREDLETVSIMAGTLDLPTGLKTGEHIYAADKSDYYEICDGAPLYEGRSPATALEE